MSHQDIYSLKTRRQFLGKCGLSLGAIALASLMRADAALGGVVSSPGAVINPMLPKLPHFAPKAKSVIFLFMVGGPSHLDMFDYKPALNQRQGEPVPESLVKGIKFAQITEKQPKLLGSRWKFNRHGDCGAYVSELMPHTAAIVDDIAFVKTVRADDTNHFFAELQMNTGWRQAGRPSMGSWVTYGLGSESLNLPGFVVLQSGGTPRSKSGNYSAGFLPAAYQGVPFRSTGEPILNLSDPPGFSRDRQHRTIDAINKMNSLHFAATGDPEITARISAYELAFRMQTSAPELLDLTSESPETLKLYGADPHQPSFARNCLHARRLVESGVRFVQLFHGDWDHHSHLETGLPGMCESVDRASAALVTDLKKRGLLDETLVVWGGEFGRTPMAQIDKSASVGRDHHIHAFPMWLAGGGVKAGCTVGATDELGFNAVEDPCHIHDLHATILHLLGLNHEKLTYRVQGRDYRLTDVAGNVIHKLIA
ncbi:MAG TPA: DUF1501 domain-containing protein [Verrucomicrobiae bacterium]|jgi:hypothetical protein|nr:DUF1501 domain-containing protein [Verrucomicrobiae bacterium]